jgi:hypothetical protein
MAKELNERDIDTRSGTGQWSPSMAAYYLRRADELGVSLEPEPREVAHPLSRSAASHGPSHFMEK